MKTFEDLGFYSVDNLPLELVPRFADLVRQSSGIERAALVVDVREGMRLDEFPAILKKVRKVLRQMKSAALEAGKLLWRAVTTPATSGGGTRPRD